MLSIPTSVTMYETSLSIGCISVITQDGDTALTLASEYCGTEAVVELVRAGAEVNLLTNVCWCCV